MSNRSETNRSTSNRSETNRAFTLVEIMIVVLIISILLAIAIPNFIGARESSRAKACVGNLAQINSAKMQCSMDNRLAAGSSATFSIDAVTATTPGANGNYQLVTYGGTANYMRSSPHCPSSGTYATGTVTLPPTCDVAMTATNPDFQPGGKWYHGY